MHRRRNIERERAVGMLRAGTGVAHVARTLHWSRCVIYDLNVRVQLTWETANRQVPGRSRVTSLADDRQIRLRHLRNRFLPQQEENNSSWIGSLRKSKDIQHQDQLWHQLEPFINAHGMGLTFQHDNARPPLIWPCIPSESRHQCHGLTFMPSWPQCIGMLLENGFTTFLINLSTCKNIDVVYRKCYSHASKSRWGDVVLHLWMHGKDTRPNKLCFSNI